MRNSRILVAVSGGSDSTALFHLLAALRQQLSIAQVGVAHVNHGLRAAESNREEEFVAQLAGDNSCPFHVKRLTGLTLDHHGLEEKARSERYLFFHSVRKQSGYDFIATGHTADDQAETVLMRILRGSGLNGLAGIRPVRNDGVIRPILALHRAQLKSWLLKRGLTYCDDSSNADQRFTRNWVRHTIIPLLKEREPKAVEHFCWLAESARRQADELEPLINKWISDHVISEEDNRFSLRKWPEDSDAKIVSESIAALFRRREIPFDKKNVELFRTQCRRTSGQFLLPAGWRFYPQKAKIDVIYGELPPAVKKEFACRLTIPGTTECSEGRCRFIATMKARTGISLMYDRANVTAYLDAAAVGDRLTYRCAREDDKFWPLGADRPHDLMRYLKSHKIKDRQNVGVVESKKGKIVWIPRLAISQTSRVTNSTDTIIKISYQPY